jgi:hypothetical protein
MIYEPTDFPEIRAVVNPFKANAESVLLAACRPAELLAGGVAGELYKRIPENTGNPDFKASIDSYLSFGASQVNCDNNGMVRQVRDSVNSIVYWAATLDYYCYTKEEIATEAAIYAKETFDALTEEGTKAFTNAEKELKSSLDRIFLTLDTAPEGDAADSNLYKAMGDISMDLSKFSMATSYFQYQGFMMPRAITNKCSSK